MQYKRRGSYTETGRQELGSAEEKYKSFIYFLYWPPFFSFLFSLFVLEQSNIIVQLIQWHYTKTNQR